MPVTNPCCCGCSLRTGTQVVAIVNIVLSSIVCLFLFLGVFGLGVLAAVGTENLSKHSTNSNSEYDSDSGVQSSSDSDFYEFKKSDLQKPVLIFFIISVVMLLVVIFELVSSIVLLIGANTGHHGKCRFWYIVTFVFLVLYTIRSISEIVLGGMNGGFAVAFVHFVSFLIGFAITGYQLWVVYAFMEELKEGGSSLPTSGAGYVHGPAGGPGPQAYVFTKPGDGPGQMPPPYSQTQEGYVAVPLNYPQGSGYPPAMPYPQQQQQPGFYPNLAEAEKGHNY